MPRKYVRLAAALLTSLVLASVLVGLFFEPEIVSLYWHLRFGKSTGFHGWRIPVPEGWWAFTRDDQLIIQKMARFYEREDPAGIIVELLRPGQPIDPEVLKDASIRTNSRDGYALQEDKPITIGTKNGYCLRFSAVNGKKGVRVSCDSLPAQLSLDFYGRPSDIQTLYEVIGQMWPD